MQITITKTGKLYAIAFPYDSRLVEAVRSLPERKWDKVGRRWTVPVSTGRQLKQWADRIQGVEIVMDDAIRAEISAVTQREEQSIQASRAATTDVEIPVPEGLAYLPYQQAGIHYALQRPNTLIADQMGLGKTIQAIGFWNADPSVKSALIICPASLRLNWQREWRKWDVRHTQIGIAIDRVPPTPVVIVNYDVLKKHITEIHRRHWDLLICDEAHYMKSFKAQRTVYVMGGKKKLPKEKGKPQEYELIAPIKSVRKLALTGTPIVNKPAEAWTLVHWLAPDVFSSWYKFGYRYCSASAGAYGIEVGGASNLDELQDRLRATIMVRRLKEDVLKELPPKRRQIIEFEADLPEVAREQAAYKATQGKLEALKLAVELAKGGTDDEYRSAVDALKLGATAAFTEMSKLRHETALAKVPLVIEHLKEATDGAKVVCFAWHKDVIAAINKEFPGTHVSITGDTAMQARQAAVDRFQTDASCVLFVGNMQAAGVGLTLTAASHVVFAELDWVPGNLTQAEDRCHRIGQHDSVLVQHLVLEGSLDATMARRVVEKQKIIDAALDTQSEIVQQPILPMMPQDVPATENTTRKQIVEEAEKLTPAQIAAIHLGLQMLSGVCDGALVLDGAGFNKFDSAIGKSLAGRSSLTPKQAALGKRLVRKYKRQLPVSVIQTVLVDTAL